MANQAVVQPAPGAAHSLQQVESGQGQQLTQLQVIAAAPSPADLMLDAQQTSWPRVPGGVLLGRDAQGRTWLCGGLLPCGHCVACQAARHLACDAPWVPGSGTDQPGGLASVVALPGTRMLAPADDIDPRRQADVVGLVACAGTSYQAAAMAGMVPGDAVLVMAHPGPSTQLAVRTLAALGLSPVQVDSDQTADQLPELPPRCHGLDLAPGQRSMEAWCTMAPRCLSLTLACPRLPRLNPALDRLLGGQVALRWVPALHPHLLLDLAAMAMHGEVDVAPQIEPLDLPQMPAAMDALVAGSVTRWPVMLRPERKAASTEISV